MTLDHRLHAHRPDLADARLEGQVAAERYFIGEPARVTSGLADLRRAPQRDAPLDAQLWHGEAVRRFEERNGWAWVQAERDGYVGYTPAECLGRLAAGAATHLVSALATYRFPEPDIKAPPAETLPLGAQLHACSAKEDFLELGDGGYVFARHTERADKLWPDAPATALRFLGIPYLWGGRSFLGVDCSGLAQTALLLAGVAAPRDSDMLRDSDTLAKAMPPDSPRKRGDLLFSPGHVVMALDGEEVVHANAYHLAVVREPFAAFAERLAERGQAVTLLRRR